MDDRSHSLFAFDPMAESYDYWYETDIGRHHQEGARSRRMPGCHFEVGDACCLPTGNRIHQVVAVMSVLEFVTTPGTVVEGLARNIRHGGSRAGSTFLHMLRDRGLFLCDKATGTYIVAEVQP